MSPPTLILTWYWLFSLGWWKIGMSKSNMFIVKGIIVRTSWPTWFFLLLSYLTTCNGRPLMFWVFFGRTLLGSPDLECVLFSCICCFFLHCIQKNKNKKIIFISINSDNNNDNKNIMIVIIFLLSNKCWRKENYKRSF